MAAPHFVWLMVHNPFPYPQYFDLAVDRRALGPEADLAVLLPQVTARPELRKLDAPGVRVLPAKRKGWWTPALEGAGRRSLVYAAQVAHPDDDPCRRTPAIPGLLVPPGKPLRVGIVVRAGRRARPGDTAQFSIVQRTGDLIVGGSTYELRIPPLVVAARRGGF
jgi:hypothetical protein